MNLSQHPDVRNCTPEEKAIALDTRLALDKVLTSIEGQQKGLETDFVKLGTLLVRIRQEKLWLFWEFKSYNNFLESVEPRVHKGRTHLYACSRIAEQLLPVMDEDDLITTGISKASALASAVKKSGKTPSDELLASAKDPATTVEKLEQLIGGELGNQDDYEEGTWRPLSGIFMSDEEWAVFLRAVKVACRVDPPMKQIITNWHDASAGERKEVLSRWISEFLSSYESLVERGEG